MKQWKPAVEPAKPVVSSAKREPRRSTPATTRPRSVVQGGAEGLGGDEQQEGGERVALRYAAQEEDDGGEVAVDVDLREGRARSVSWTALDTTRATSDGVLKGTTTTIEKFKRTKGEMRI